MKKLYIDFDGVILDTITPSVKKMEEQNVNQKEFKEVREFFRNEDWSKLIKESEIINSSIECIQKIKATGNFSISILTHVNSIEEGVHKVDYIRSIFDDISIIIVPREISKARMVIAKDAILIDDYFKNLDEWQAAGGEGILFSQKLEKKPYKVINRLDEILETSV